MSTTTMPSSHHRVIEAYRASKVWAGAIPFSAGSHATMLRTVPGYHGMHSSTQVLLQAVEVTASLVISTQTGSRPQNSSLFEPIGSIARKLPRPGTTRNHRAGVSRPRLMCERSSRRVIRLDPSQDQIRLRLLASTEPAPTIRPSAKHIVAQSYRK